MKIARILSLALCVVLLLLGCGANNTQTDKTAKISNEDLVKNNTELPDVIDDKPLPANPSPIDYESIKINVSDAKGKYPGPELPTSNVYVNEQCGYTLTFPDSWKGWYYIKDQNPEYIEVYFYGKSLTGTVHSIHSQNIYKSGYGDYGLCMFYIVSERTFEKYRTCNVIKCIGNSKGVKYYYAIPSVEETYILSESEHYWDEIDDEEINLALKDWEKLKQMGELYDYSEVYKTFKGTDEVLFYLSEAREKYQVEKPQNNVYINEKNGYTLTFPDSWYGWYYIDDTNPDAVKVNFCGKSMTAAVLNKYFSDAVGKSDKDGYGILFFTIVAGDANNNTLPGHIVIPSGGDGSLCYYVVNNEINEEFELLIKSLDLWEDIDENEKELVQKDREKANEIKWWDIKFEYLK